MQQDQRDFAEFYAATRDDCLRVVLLTARDRLLAEDLVAEAYTRAWLSWRKVRALDQPRAWVVRTALNTRISWWRRRRREVGLDGQDHDHASPASQDGISGSGLDTDLVAALRRLPARQREVVALRLLLDLDTASTAEALGLADGTVASHLHRALTALRRDLRPHPDAGPIAGRPDPRPGRPGPRPDGAGHAGPRPAVLTAGDQELTP